MSNNKLIAELLRTQYTLIRRKKHLIYRHNITGKLVTISRTPSDCHSNKNILHDLQRGCQ